MVSRLHLLPFAVAAVLQCCTIAVSNAQTCLAGSYQQADKCVACPKGHFCLGNTSPMPCQPGTASASGSDRCRKCSAGWYQDKSGQYSCNQCPEGYQCPKSGAAPMLCPPGTMSYYTVGDRVSCLNCSSGAYQDKSGQRQCMWCPAGHFCSKSPESRPSACPTGYRSYSSTGDRAQCYRCPAGFYKDRSGQADCMPCPVGHYCPAVPDSRPEPCPTGTVSYSNVGGRTDCRTCSAGYYQNKVGQANCLPCPDGHYCLKPEMPPQACPPGHVSWSQVSHKTSCRKCPSGYFQDKSGQTNCIVCPDGHFCAQSETRPSPCPSGFTSWSSISNRYSCRLCSQGQCTTPVQPMVQCSPGSVAIDKLKCAPCHFDKYQDQSGQTVCKECPNGHYCLTSSASPVQCLPGTYSTTQMTNRAKCLPCSAGEYQYQAGQSVCLTCPNGHHCPNAAAPPTRCPLGTYSTTEMQDRLVCAACPKGTYQDETGQWQCKTCPDGFLCPTPDVSPVQCPPGTFSTTSTLIRTACLPCPPGTYQDQCGQPTCKTCPSEHCPNLWAAAACTSLKSLNRIPDYCSSSQACPNLKEIGNVFAVSKAPPTPNRYSGQPVQTVLGNNNAFLEVVSILPEHRTATNVNDTTITVSTAQEFDRMATAASGGGVDIRIESGFRSLARQQYLWECYESKKCEHKAARPGTSNHGTGIALDLNTNCGMQSGDRAPIRCASSPVYIWLLGNAHNFGFIRTEKSEPHHWEYKGGTLGGPADFAKLE